MNRHDESDGELGNPWLAIAVGAVCIVLAWYVYAKMGANPHFIGKASLANSGLGRTLLAGLVATVGIFFVVRGIGKLRSGD